MRAVSGEAGQAQPAEERGEAGGVLGEPRDLVMVKLIALDGKTHRVWLTMPRSIARMFPRVVLERPENMVSKKEDGR